MVVAFSEKNQIMELHVVTGHPGVNAIIVDLRLPIGTVPTHPASSCGEWHPVHRTPLGWQLYPLRYDTSISASLVNHLRFRSPFCGEGAERAKKISG